MCPTPAVNVARSFHHQELAVSATANVPTPKPASMVNAEIHATAERTLSALSKVTAPSARARKATKEIRTSLVALSAAEATRSASQTSLASTTTASTPA